MHKGIIATLVSAAGALLLFSAAACSADTLNDPLRYLGSTPLSGAAITPDGSTIATCCSDPNIKIWDADSGKCRAILQGHTAAVASIAFSPDGSTLLSGSWDKTAKLWNLSNRTCLLTLARHSSRVMAVAFSPDGKKCMTGSDDQTARIWDVATGTCLRTLVTEPLSSGSGVHCVAFSPDGARVLTGTTSLSQLWDAATGDLIRNFTGQFGEICWVCFSPDGARILTGSQENNEVIMWDASTGLTVKKLYGGSNGSYYPSSFSPDGQYILINKRLLSLDGDTIRTFSGHTNIVVSSVFSADGSKVLTGSGDRTAKLWNTTTGECLQTFSDSHTGNISAVAFTPDGTKAITGSWDSSASCFDLSTGRQLWKFSRQSKDVNTVALSPDGSLLALGTDDSSVYLLNSADGSTVQTCSMFTAPIFDVAFTSDGSKILATGTGKAFTWNPATQDTTIRSIVATLIPAKFSPDGSKLLVAYTTNFKCVNSVTGDSLQDFTGHTDRILALSFSPDGQRCASGSLDKSIKLWDLATGSCMMTFTGHSNGVRALTFSSDGMKIVSGSLDSTARLWDVATGNCDRVFRVRSQLLSVAISRNGSRILTGSANFFTKVWPTTYSAGTKPQPLLHPHRDIRFLFANSRSLVFKIPAGATLSSGAAVRLYALDGSLLFDLPASRSTAANELALFALPTRLAAGTYVYDLSGVCSRSIDEVSGVFTISR